MSLLRVVGFGYEPPAPVEGKGVTLRMPDLSDYSAWRDLRLSSRDFLAPWEPTWAPDELQRASFRRRVIRYRQDWRDDVGYAFFVLRKPDDVLVGGLTLTNVRRGVSQTCSLGYWMGEVHAGKGHMSAAVSAVLDYAFGPLGFRRMEAACVPTNGPSVRLLERVGFRREGLAREYLCIDGRWMDHALYGVLKGDRG